MVKEVEATLDSILPAEKCRFEYALGGVNIFFEQASIGHRLQGNEVLLAPLRYLPHFRVRHRRIYQWPLPECLAEEVGEARIGFIEQPV